MKRFVVALIAGAAVFALAFGSAATLTVNGEVIRPVRPGHVCLGRWSMAGIGADNPAAVFVRSAGVDMSGAGHFVNVTNNGTNHRRARRYRGTTVTVNFAQPASVPPARHRDWRCSSRLVWSWWWSS
jgi:hypothetical protein